MMELILPFQIPAPEQTIRFKDKVLCIGSCFAEEVGSLMDKHMFDMLVNPHGILFNSFSIIRALEDLVTHKQYTSKELVTQNNLWHSMHHHGRFSEAEPDRILSNINGSITEAHEFLRNAQWLCITLGSSWVYRYTETGEVVANCHKIPQQRFTKELLEAEVQTQRWNETIASLRKLNRDLKIIFTVSPVRYVRDGLVENNLSKAHLLTTVHALSDNDLNCFYFPAYELVNDVLRDYRFFKEDLVHPNEQAVRFVFDQFIDTYLDKGERGLFDEISSYLKFSSHRPLHERETATHGKKVEAMLEEIKAKLKKMEP
jgi:hypothetical protein